MVESERGVSEVNKPKEVSEVNEARGVRGVSGVNGESEVEREVKTEKVHDGQSMTTQQTTHSRTRCEEICNCQEGQESQGTLSSVINKWRLDHDTSCTTIKPLEDKSGDGPDYTMGP